MKNKLTILLTVYNKEDYIRNSIESILKNNADFEFLICDDCSTDGSKKVLKEYADKYNLIKVFYNKKNMGASNTRNFLISKVKTSHYIFVDADDLIDNDFVEKITEEINKNNKIDVISVLMKKIFDDREEFISKTTFEETTGAEGLYLFIKNHDNFISPTTFAFRTEFWNKNKFLYKPGTYYEDFGLIPSVLMKAKTMVSIDYCGYHYIMTDNSLMRNNDEKKDMQKVKDIIGLSKILLSDIEKVKLDNYYKKTFNLFVVDTIIRNYYYSSRIIKKETKLAFKKMNYSKYIKVNNFKDFVKKVFVKCSLNLYIKFSS